MPQFVAANKKLDEVARNALVERHLKLAAKIAFDARVKFPASIDLGELQSRAYFGLLQASRHYDPALNDNFEAFARKRIFGALFDGSRRNRFKDFVHEELPESPADPRESIEQKLSRADEVGAQQRHIETVLALLPARQRAVLTLRFYGSMSLAEIGEALGVCESMICRIQSEAIARSANHLRSIGIADRASLSRRESLAPIPKA